MAFCKQGEDGGTAWASHMEHTAMGTISTLDGCVKYYVCTYIFINNCIYNAYLQNFMYIVANKDAYIIVLAVNTN